MAAGNKFHLTTGSIVLFAAYVLSNLRATMFVYLDPDTSRLLSPAWIEILLWLVVTAMAIGDMSRNHRFELYLRKWRANWLAGVFVFLALLSTAWSIEPTVTLYPALELLFAACAAA